MKFYEVIMEAKVYGSIRVEAEDKDEADEIAFDTFNIIDDNNIIEIDHVVTNEIKGGA